MKRKAIALMSGGLDSNLAVRMVHDLGIEIVGVHFTGPFCQCNRGTGGPVAPEPRSREGGCIHYAKKIAGELGLRFSTIGLGSEYLDIVLHPRHGRGSGMNPCLDCRILMFRKAAAMMKAENALFILTGEVLGQRPMSQLRDKLRLIEREAELEGLILRPLSARHLPPTIPEKEGWVPRETLLNIRGRGRRTQMDLAEMLQIGDYPCPAGGCLLTDKHFAARLHEHIEHAGELKMSDIPLLKVGRHFRLPSGAKLIVGRDQTENEQIERLADSAAPILFPESTQGPTAVLLSGSPTDADHTAAAEIVVAYCKGHKEVAMTWRFDGSERTVAVTWQDRSPFAEMRA